MNPIEHLHAYHATMQFEDVLDMVDSLSEGEMSEFMLRFPMTCALTAAHRITPEIACVLITMDTALAYPLRRQLAPHAVDLLISAAPDTAIKCADVLTAHQISELCRKQPLGTMRAIPERLSSSDVDFLVKTWPKAAKYHLAKYLTMTQAAALMVAESEAPT